MPRSIRDSADPPYRASVDRWDQGPGGLNATLEFWGAAQPPTTPLLGGMFWHWTGVAWVRKPAKVWFQGQWLQRIARRWTGTQWIPINPE